MVLGLGATASIAQEVHRRFGVSDDIAIFNYGQPSIPAASWDNRPQITKWLMVELNGINDYRAHSTGATVANRKKSICTYARTLGIKVIGTTVMKQGILDANYTQTDQDQLDAGNVILKTTLSDYCDALVDLNALPNAQGTANTVYFDTDQLHHKPPLNNDKAAAVFAPMPAMFAS